MGEALSSCAFTISNVIESLPLTRAKRQLLSRITDLDIAGKKRGLSGCIAKNKSLGRKVGLAETTVSKYIREMKAEGYLVAGTFHGHYRILNSNLSNAVEMERFQYNLSKFQEKNPRQSSANILGSHLQEYGAAPYESTEHCTSNQSTNTTSNKNKEDSSSKINWLNIAEHAKTMILKEYGEYDFIPEKEKEKIKLWQKLCNDNPKISPETIIETIRKLIYIKEKYQTNSFWSSIPVNIASSYSYKDKIKSTYNALLQTSSNTITKQSTKGENVSQERNLNIDRKYQDPSWEAFLNWSSKRLTRSSIEILKRVQAQFRDNGTLLILNTVPESLEIIIKKYFSEEVQILVPVEFLNGTRLGEKPDSINSKNNVNQGEETFSHEELMQALAKLGKGKPWNTQLASAPLQNQKRVGHQIAGNRTTSNYVLFQSKNTKNKFKTGMRAKPE
ncbi:hypothetical protein [Leptospira sp. P2653]|uniref:hypothetical protein n=1 Tax=Leptospira sp. P2653 TaxID=1218600 RepID=UPI0002BF9EB5|nr:hypothetical protein [Leptospira sp. P2653]EMJ62820.1 hypothetical protein LEP1GSC051_3351 [Leptospira sp. P2653]